MTIAESEGVPHLDFRLSMTRGLARTALAVLLSTAACGGGSAPAGGPITGQPLDTHCASLAPQPVGLCQCTVPSTSEAGTAITVTKSESVAMCIEDGAVGFAKVSLPGRGLSAVAGSPATAAPASSQSRAVVTETNPRSPLLVDFGATMNGSTGGDDDCKYGVSWTSTPIHENADVTFFVTLQQLASVPPLLPATGGVVSLEAFLTLLHVADVSRTKSLESPAGSGIYQVGPIRFDAPGNWTVRFHFNEPCSDESADSPHGHAAFYVQVP